MPMTGVGMGAPSSGGGVQNPSQIFSTNLIGWWRADQGVFSNTGCSTPATNNGSVGCWADQSGNGCSLTQSGGSQQPTFLSAGLNSKQTVQFTASNSDNVNCTTFNPGSGSVFSIFAVLFGTSSSNVFARVISYDNDAAAFILDNSTSVFLLWNGGSVATANVANNAVCRLSGIFDGTNGTTYKQNVQQNQAAATVTLAGSQNLFVGTSSGSGSPFDGSFSEIVLTNNAATSGQRTSLDSWLSQQWGSATC